MKNSILTLALILTSLISFSQTIATTSDGKKVELNDDGTWKYQETKTDNTSVSLECSDLIETETDKMTGKTTTGLKKAIIISSDGGKNGFGLYIMKSSINSIILNITVVGAGSCIDDDNKVIILFRDGTRLNLLNEAGFNCKKKANIYFSGSWGKRKELNMLMTKEIETMRVWTTNSYVEEDFTKEQSQKVMKVFNCLNQ